MRRSTRLAHWLAVTLAAGLLGPLPSAQRSPTLLPAVGLAIDIDVRGPVSRIDTLEGGQVTATFQISPDGRSAVFTSPTDKTLRGEYRYDLRTRWLSYTEQSRDGRLSFFTDYSAGGCPLRSEVTPQKGSGFPATTTVTRCDAGHRAVRTEQRVTGVRDPVLTTLSWAPGGRVAQVTTVDRRGRGTREERYDAQGRFVRSEGVDASGTQLTTTVTHTDDARGNWLTRRTVTETHFACTPDPVAARYGLKCEPDPRPQVELEQRRITYR
ncbi:hypothetical protein [Deinococcus sp. QL22]|uniref:hypothetical protein n=1 Tax=Deinococcus sp. QL22 TaxID=2939437 RepID=UPI002017A07D|nr:hypothetical protein [Deinococcus sp. QL22]UQN06543.1 hypothetical protein M1R55_01075 [Deinococcus sp. QL22]